MCAWESQLQYVPLLLPLGRWRSNIVTLVILFERPFVDATVFQLQFLTRLAGHTNRFQLGSPPNGYADFLNLKKEMPWITKAVIMAARNGMRIPAGSIKSATTRKKPANENIPMSRPRKTFAAPSAPCKRWAKTVKMVV